MSGEGKGSNVARVVICTLLFLPLAFLFLVFASRDQWMILLPFRLVFGWLIHATKALPHLFGKWDEAILPLGCLLMAAVIAHRFVRRWVDEKFPERTWRIRHTAGALSLLLLGSAAAIAASGVVHQMFWLAGGKVIENKTWIEPVMAFSNGRQLMLALMEYHDAHGRYPDSFEQLGTQEGFDPESIRRLSWLESRDGKLPEPWLLLNPGFAEAELDTQPVILSPVMRKGQKVALVVGYSDGSVRRVHVNQLKDILRQAGTKEGKGVR
jgi:hypothetical protein